MANIEQQGNLWNQFTQGIGTLWNNISGKTEQNRFSAAEAEKQRNWEEQMSSSAYQRGTEDMIKAGINPAMMYSNGANPASTPGGAHASSAGGGGDPISSIINSAANLARAFNYDKNPKNDVTTKQIFDDMGKLQKTIYTENNKF